jgi:hypothetical protein
MRYNYDFLHLLHWSFCRISNGLLNIHIFDIFSKFHLFLGFGMLVQPAEVLGQFVFLDWNASSTFFSILNIFNIPINLIQI